MKEENIFFYMLLEQTNIFQYETNQENKNYKVQGVEKNFAITFHVATL